MYSLEIVIVARSLRSLVKTSPSSQPIRYVRKLEKNRLLTEKRKQEGLVLGSAIVFRTSAASGRRSHMCHKPMVWHVVILKYSHQPEEPKSFILVLFSIGLFIMFSAA